MRAQARQLRHEEEEESAFVSMTDMTVGFLFIIMILLAFFASQIRDPDSVPRSSYEQVRQDRDDWRERAETRAVTIQRLEGEVQQLELEKDTLENEVQALRTEKKELTESLEDALSKIEELEKRIAKLEREVDEKNAKIEQLKSRLKRLEEVDPLEAYLAQVADVRRQVLTKLRDAIRADFPDLQVELSEESDALRFQGEGLFATGSPNLAREKRTIVSRLAKHLDGILPCYTIGPKSTFAPTCNEGFVMIEAVQIEGHTDNKGTDVVNRNLSAARANNTFFAMSEAAENLRAHLNLKRQPVLSVAAYGPDRPVASNDTKEGRSTNRRIDLRFIMVSPQDTKGIEQIRAALQNVGAPE